MHSKLPCLLYTGITSCSLLWREAYCADAGIFHDMHNMFTATYSTASSTDTVELTAGTLVSGCNEMVMEQLRLCIQNTA